MWQQRPPSSADARLPASVHLVTGVTGQDGVHLARALHAAGHVVVGTWLPEHRSPHLVHLPRSDRLRLAALDVRDDATFAQLLEQHRPDVVHHLAALSSVGDSWQQRDLTDEVNHRAVVRMLARLEEHAQRHGRAPRLLFASSSEIFGAAVPGALLDERSPLRPVSPYGEAKARAHEAVVAARARGLDATSLVLFGHTSPLHAPRFVLRQIVRQSAERALGRREVVAVRDPSVARDWGSAPDLMRAFVAAAAAERTEDLVVATGRAHTLGEIAEWAADAAARDAADTSGGRADAALVVGGPDTARPRDVTGVCGDASRAEAVLGWRPTVPLRAEVERMVRVDLRRLRTGVEEDPALLDLPALAPAGAPD